MSPYQSRPAGAYPLEPKVKRTCLSCERKFTARGRFNRICPTCLRLPKFHASPMAARVLVNVRPDYFPAEQRKAHQ